jgi:RHS repeat-associated protein
MITNSREKKSWAAIFWMVAVIIMIYPFQAAGASRGELTSSSQNITRGVSLKVGDPISAANGAYAFALPFFELGGPMNLNFTFYYSQNIRYYFPDSSRMPFAGGTSKFWWSPYICGALWGSAYDNTDCNDVRLTDGNVVSFWRDKDTKTYELTLDQPSWGAMPDNGQPTGYVMKETDHFIYMMDPIKEQVHLFENIPDQGESPVIYSTDRNQNTLQYSYAEGPYDFNNPLRLEKVEDGLGRSLNFGYTPDDFRLQTVTDHGGRVVTFAYDATPTDHDNKPVIRSIQDPAGNTYTFTYQSPAETGDAYFLITQLHRPEGNTHYVNEFAQQTIDGISEARVIRQTDADGHQTQLTYNDGYVNTITYPDGATETFDHSSALAPPQSLTDNDGETIDFTKNDRNQVTSVTDRLGDATTFTYHPESGKLASITNNNGQTITYEYTAQNQTFTNPINSETIEFTFYNLTAIVYPDDTRDTFSYDGNGNMTGLTDREGNSWSLTYNTRGQITKITNPAGGISEWGYNDVDATVLWAEDSDTGRSDYTYDALKRLTRIDFPDGSSMEYAYDANDQITSIRNGNGHTVTFTYDGNGNMTKSTGPDGKFVQADFDAMDRYDQVTDKAGKTWKFNYDSRGRLAGVTNPENDTTIYDYDLSGNLNKVIDPENGEWVFTFDKEGMLASFVSPLNQITQVNTNKLGLPTGQKDALDLQRTLTYDNLNQVTEIVDQVGRTFQYGYSSGGRLESLGIQGFGEVAYAYNAMGGLSEITDLSGQRWSFDTTPMGRLAGLTDPLGQTGIMQYDSRGRVSRLIDPGGGIEEFTYDGVGNIVQRSFSGGQTLDFTYDDYNRLTSAHQVTFQYNDQDLITRTAYGADTYDVMYDNMGQLIQADYGGGFQVSYEYDRRGLLSRVSDSLGNALDFTHDAASRLTNIIRSNGVDTTYSRDDASRLTGILDSPLANQTYTLNGEGDVISADLDLPGIFEIPLVSGQDIFTYDNASQLSSTGYTYDPEGKLVQSPDTGLTWDEAGRLTGINGVTLGYDGLNGLYSRQTDDMTTFYHHQYAISMGPVIIETQDGSPIRYFIWTPGGQLLYMIDVAGGNTPYFYHFDRNGSTLFLSDESGEASDVYTYTPYGNLIQQDGDSDQPFTFVGQFGVRREAENLYHMRARYYDPKTARFLSRDPLWPNQLSLLEINPYAYAGLNPVTRIDPSGGGWFSDWARDLWTGITNPGTTISGLWAPSPEEAQVQAQLEATGRRVWKSEAWQQQRREIIMQIKCRLKKLDFAISPGEWGERKRLMDMLQMLADKEQRWSPESIASVNNLARQGDLALNAIFKLGSAVATMGATAKGHAALEASKELAKFLGQNLAEEIMDIFKDNVNCDCPKKDSSPKKPQPPGKSIPKKSQEQMVQEASKSHTGERKALQKSRQISPGGYGVYQDYYMPPSFGGYPSGQLLQER